MRYSQLLSALAMFGLMSPAQTAHQEPQASDPVQTDEATQAKSEFGPKSPQQWRVTWTTDPQHTATISWSTASETEVNRVHIRSMKKVSQSDPQDEEQARSIDAHHNGAFTLNGSERRDMEPFYYHHVRLDGLEPGVLYEFELESDGVLSRTLCFRSAPAADSEQSFSLIYGGDSRTGKEARQRMNRLLSELVVATPNVIAFVHGGDYVFDGHKFGLWTEWLSHDELRTTPSGLILPIIPTRGNHDFGNIFDEVFDTPGGVDKNYFHTSLPAGVNLLTLNTNISHAGEQREWLASQLGILRPESRWLMAQYHRPAYPAVKSAGESKAAWVPLFDANDMDLVFESDGHTIKRTLAIRDDKPDPTGVVYIGEGGLGVPQRAAHSERWYLQEPGFSDQGHHLTLVTFSGDELRLLTQGFEVDKDSGLVADPNGEIVIFDDHVMRRRGAE